ncbi:MAG: peptide chain release factor N(5)-glutamine methyltransferase [Candidatus Omnitrophica bacterium]|nr:peptide chain release factor N(5)-glutamine methyltransferase [Candidatus Omnitrophota bacterium]
MNPKLVMLLDQGSQFLVQQGFKREEARREAERLLASSLRISKPEMLRDNPSFVEVSMERDFLFLLQQRAGHVPLQYLEGEVDFMDFPFRVTPDVLIPRPETENLIERILVHGSLPTRILDIGTGSGCILLSLLKYFSGSSGLGIDISERALEIARENAGRLGLTERVSFQTGDLLSGLADQQFDLIVSNPPYVREVDWNDLSAEVKQEPREALVAGPSGLECYEKIIATAQKHLVPGGKIFFEVGWNQADQVAEMLAASGYQKVKKFLDDFGVERIVKAENHGWIKSSSTADAD